MVGNISNGVHLVLVPAVKHEEHHGDHNGDQVQDVHDVDHGLIVGVALVVGRQPRHHVAAAADLVVRLTATASCGVGDEVVAIRE